MMRRRRVNTLIIGSGAAGLAAAVRLCALGVKDILLVSEGLDCGVSVNSGSDKQTYYKLGLYGFEPDSPHSLAHSLFDSGGVHGDLALVEASLSARCFLHLVDLGVPFPCDEFGQHIGYKTDHDPLRRATSCGPYTSREMCVALAAAAQRSEVEILEKRVAAELLKVGGRAAGALIYNQETCDFEVILAENTVLATGGPGGLYQESVYPPGHLGSIGLAFKIGAMARNLPESQFGLASTKFRWNVSGSYMQVLPRFISTASDGVSDEREFLLDHFATSGEMNSMIFLKGYQWPFDVRKALSGSSLVDALVYDETVKKGRRVFLDFRMNSTAGLDFALISEEARLYLERSGACFGTPFERLEKMNPGAIELYRRNRIDLSCEPLEIAVCAQHNNGGLAGDIWYESVNIPHLFPIGEVNGSHGVFRPGGSALNAGQVGAFRAAEFIAARYQHSTLDENATFAEAEMRCTSLRDKLRGSRDWQADRAVMQRRMTEFGGHLRRVAALADAVTEAKALFLAVEREGYPPDSLPHSLWNFHLLRAHWVYLSAIAFQAASGVGSRGGCALLGDDGSLIPEKPSFRRFTLDTVCTEDGGVESRWIPCRPIPESDGWFESVWRRYRSGEVYERV